MDLSAISSISLKDRVWRRQLVILDLNGILISRIHINDVNNNNNNNNNLESIRIGNYLVWKRPHLDSFLDFLFGHYDVAVWSSISKHNITDIVKFVFDDHYNDLIFIYDQTKCERVNFEPKQDTEKCDVLRKNLIEVWKEYPQYDQDNTLIIDNSDDKMINNLQFKGCHFNPGTWTHDQINDVALKRDGNIIETIRFYKINVP